VRCLLRMKGASCVNLHQGEQKWAGRQLHTMHDTDSKQDGVPQVVFATPIGHVAQARQRVPPLRKQPRPDSEAERLTACTVRAAGEREAGRR
jgi:hypothetical protein